MQSRPSSPTEEREVEANKASHNARRELRGLGVPCAKHGILSPTEQKVANPLRATEGWSLYAKNEAAQVDIRGLRPEGKHDESLDMGPVTLTDDGSARRKSSLAWYKLGG
ncbi:unnamed protein product [Penicillium glandicola]